MKASELQVGDVVEFTTEFKRCPVKHGPLTVAKVENPFRRFIGISFTNGQVAPLTNEDELNGWTVHRNGVQIHPAPQSEKEVG